MAKFERAITGVRATGDDRGTVRITVSLMEGSSNKKGNISRGLTVKDAKVSEVVEAIEGALFSE